MNRGLLWETTLSDYKNINFDPKNEENEENQPQNTNNSQFQSPMHRIRNKITVLADEDLFDFDFLDFELIYLIAVVCRNSVLIYSLTKSTQKVTLESKKVFACSGEISDKPENLYAVSFGSLASGGLVLICGGLFGFIYVVYMEDDRVEELASNNGEVLAVEFMPESAINIERRAWLLVGYKNGYTLLWDIDSCWLVATFRNFNQNPPSDVLSVSWHGSGDYFVTTHSDTRVIIWEIDEEIRKTQGKKGKKIEKSIPFKEPFDAHSNYVDCARFWGNLLVSKDCEGNLLMWTPFKDSIFLINAYKYELTETLFFVKFTLNRKENMVCLGNNTGTVFLYKLKEGGFEKNNNNEKNGNKYFNVEKQGWDAAFRTDDSRELIRKAVVTEDGTFLFCISDYGRLLWKKLNL